MVDWPRSEVMRHMLGGENIALLWTRPMSPSYQFSCLCSTHIIDQCVVGNKSAGAGISYCGPLYLYPDADRHGLFTHLEPAGRRPNLNPAVVAALAAAHGHEPAPEEIFGYVYAVLYAPAYRKKYAEFLRMDFPRIPFPADREVFAALAALGERLAALHLLKSPELDTPAARFEGAGNGLVAKSKGLRYDARQSAGLHQPNSVLRARARGRLGVPGRRLPGLPQVAQRPAGAAVAARRHPHLLPHRHRARAHDRNPGRDRRALSGGRDEIVIYQPEEGEPVLQE